MPEARQKQQMASGSDQELRKRLFSASEEGNVQGVQTVLAQQAGDGDVALLSRGWEVRGCYLWHSMWRAWLGTQSAWRNAALVACPALAEQCVCAGAVGTSTIFPMATVLMIRTRSCLCMRVS